MKYFLAFLTCTLLIIGSGCALFGVHPGPDGTTTAEPGGGIVGTIFSIAGLPWVATVIGGLTAAYANAKRGQWKAAATSTLDGIEEAKKTPEGMAAWKKIKEKVVASHTAKKVTKLIEKTLGNT